LKRLSRFGQSLGLLLLSHALGQEVAVTGVVVGVHDGDRLTVLLLSNTQIKIRVAFLDAPELGQPFGYRAKQAMSDLVFGKSVLFYPHAIDRYGRTVAQVVVDGTDAGRELLGQGLCWIYSRYIEEARPEIQASYRQAEAEARAHRRGLWSDTREPVPPWKWRREAKQAAEGF
jgi:endonuclease YncB( thermonuclease family)